MATRRKLDVQKIRRKYRNAELRNALLFTNVDKFFSDEKNFDRLHYVLGNTDSHPELPRISLRTLEHFVTAYAQRNNVTYSFQNQVCNVTEKYENYLDTHGKANFDVFRRSPEKKYIVYKKFGKQIITTLSQLVFFKVMIEYGMLDYVVRHLHEIEQDMARRKQKKEDVSSSAPPTPTALIGKGIHEIELGSPRPPEKRAKIETVEDMQL